MANESRVSELILRLRDEVSAGAKSAGASLGSLQNKLTSFAGALGVGIGAGALIGFGKSVIESAGHLQDLSEQTGISAQALSGMKSVLEQSGTSVDTFAKGIFNAQKNLGSATPETLEAVRKLGLNFDELLKASPEQFLQMLAGALGKISDPLQRNTLGFQVLGKAFKELSPVLSEVAGRFDELKKSGISNEDIARLDAAGDAYTRFKNKIQVLGAGPLAKFITDFSRFMGLDLGPPQGIAAINAELDDLAEKRRRLFKDIQIAEDFGGRSPDVVAAMRGQLDETIEKQNTLIKQRNQLVEATRAEGDALKRNLELTEMQVKGAEALMKAARDIGHKVVERGGEKGLPFLADIGEIRKEFLSPFFTDFAGLGDRLTEVRQKIIDTFGTSIFDKAPGLLKDIEELQGRLKQFAEFKGIEITADTSKAKDEIDRLKSKVEEGAEFPIRTRSGGGPVTPGSIPIPFSGGAFNDPRATWSPQMLELVTRVSGSPTLPFSDYFGPGGYAEGLLEKFSSKAGSLVLKSELLTPIINTLDSIAAARTMMAAQIGTPGLHPNISAVTSSRLHESQNILNILMSLAERTGGPSTGSGQGGSMGGGVGQVIIDLRGSTISQELLDRQLVPRFEGIIRAATGKNIDYRVFN